MVTFQDENFRYLVDKCSKFDRLRHFGFNIIEHQPLLFQPFSDFPLSAFTRFNSMKKTFENISQTQFITHTKKNWKIRLTMVISRDIRIENPIKGRIRIIYTSNNIYQLCGGTNVI